MELTDDIGKWEELGEVVPNFNDWEQFPSPIPIPSVIRFLFTTPVMGGWNASIIYSYLYLRVIYNNNTVSNNWKKLYPPYTDNDAKDKTIFLNSDKYFSVQSLNNYLQLKKRTKWDSLETDYKVKALLFIPDTETILIANQVLLQQETISQIAQQTKQELLLQYPELPPSLL